MTEYSTKPGVLRLSNDLSSQQDKLQMSYNINQRDVCQALAQAIGILIAKAELDPYRPIHDNEAAGRIVNFRKSMEESYHLYLKENS